VLNVTMSHLNPAGSENVMAHLCILHTWHLAFYRRSVHVWVDGVHSWLDVYFFLGRTIAFI
jgi:hypothetical protein